MSFDIKNFTGYMLGRGDAPAAGTPWWPVDTWVFVCRDLDTARMLMENKDSGCHWTHIYRVHAPKITIETADAGIYWTRMAKSLIVGETVFVAPQARPVSEAQLLGNAQKWGRAWRHLANSLNDRERG